jgi:hypothetical protein
MGFVESLPQPVLDLGPPNALARVMEGRFGVTIDHTGTHDLDREALRSFQPGPYAAITAFEILEHLLNPGRSCTRIPPGRPGQLRYDRA